jgi:hypothetical protein
LKHNAKSPYLNKINFRILNGFDTLFQVNDVYIINDTITICTNKQNKDDKVRNDYLSVNTNNNFYNNNYINSSKNNKWVLYNLLGVETSSGIGQFKIDIENNIFETGLYILTIDGFFYKKIFIKKDK